MANKDSFVHLFIHYSTRVTAVALCSQPQWVVS